MQICGMFLEIRIKGTVGPSFHASERAVYKEFQNSILSDKEQEGFGEKSYFFRRRTAKNCAQVMLPIH